MERKSVKVGEKEGDAWEKRVGLIKMIKTDSQADISATGYFTEVL